MIDEAEVVSFDVFDTLLYRKVNEPEIIFELVGQNFGIHGFRKLRIDAQNEASRRVYESHQFPHADMNEIYEVLAEHTEIPVNWMEVKQFEIQLEEDALVANKEMLEIFRIVKEKGKRVVATSDMYLLADTLKSILEKNGYAGFDYVYCSADERKAKFNKLLFEEVSKREGVEYEKILHIGDNVIADVETPKSYGINTFHYQNDADIAKLKNVKDSGIDAGLYKILYDSDKGFWYNLGVEVGGPIYMGLYLWLCNKIKDVNKKIYFLSRDGYNLYNIFKEEGYENIEYLYMSRRSLTLACITELTSEEIDILPPYTYGQSIEEIFEYLCIPMDKIFHLEDVGFHSSRDIIKTHEDMKAFKKLYEYNKDIVLKRCEEERKNASKYLSEIGFLSSDSVVFDCGWQGSSQDLIERFKKAIGNSCQQMFYYFGIRNSDKSRKQLHGLHYDTYLFDFYKNYYIQNGVHESVAMYELFFSAPHESVYYYGDNGVVFENGDGDKEKFLLFQGIRDYISESKKFVKKYKIEYTPEIAVGHLQRLINYPTQEEAVVIGNMQNIDGFARKKGQSKYIAYVSPRQLSDNPDIEIYWINGLLKRPDISEEIKISCAKRYGKIYPEQEPSEYHLEDEQSIRNYYRWMRYQENYPESKVTLTYIPKFSVIIPVYNTITSQLKECIESVLNQSYENYELILVDDHSSWKNVVPTLKEYEDREKVQIIYRTTNGHISVATNDGIDKATGDFIAFMDCDDVLEIDALYEMAKKLNENPEYDFIYSDEDKITEDGKIRHMPFFKPDWSPDLFNCMMYTNHLGVYRTSIVKAIGGLRSAYNGSQDYDFTLRFLEKTRNENVGHVSKILYHWRERKESVAFAMNSKNYAAEAARYAKEDYIKRNNLSAHLEYISGLSQYRMVYDVVGNPLVSIVIPSKDHPDILKQCIDSIYKFTSYKNFEIIVVDNGSATKNKEIIKKFLDLYGANYIYDIFDFNFSKMCNIGADYAKGEYLLFLNDDIEIFQTDWLERMLGHAQQKHVGAVGAKLLYPETTIIQHAGVSNLFEGPSHNFIASDDQINHYFSWNRLDYNCIAVTGACLLVSNKKFYQINGFDERYPIAYNDVKLCFSLHEFGYYNVMRDDVVAYHYESLSRGSDHIDDCKLMRLEKERANLFLDFPLLKSNDPFLNINLHNLSINLDLKYSYDNLSKDNEIDAEVGGISNIDSINISDRIQIIGWSLIEHEDKMEELNRYLVFCDPYGNTYTAPALPMLRADVSNYYGEGKKYMYAGIECVLEKSKLRLDIMQYRIGILTIDKNGKRYVTWWKDTDIIRNNKPRNQLCNCKYVSNVKIYNNNADIRWYIDENSVVDQCYKIRGFAFKQDDMHYLYKQSIILVNDNMCGYEIDVQQEERIDVAAAFPEQQFLYYTGFNCYMYKEILEKGEDYNIIIRLTNRFDKDDIFDIYTGQKIGDTRKK